MLTMDQLKKAKYFGMEKGWVLPGGEKLSAEKVYDVEGDRVLWYMMKTGFVIAEKEDRNKIISTLFELADPEGFNKHQEDQNRKREWYKKWKDMSAKDILIETGLFDRLRDFVFGKVEIDDLIGKYYIDGFKVAEVTDKSIEIYAYDPDENGGYQLDTVNYNRLGLISHDEMSIIPENRKNYYLYRGK